MSLKADTPYAREVWNMVEKAAADCPDWIRHPMLWTYCYSCGLTFPAMAKRPCCVCEHEAERAERHKALWRETRELLDQVIEDMSPVESSHDSMEHLRQPHG